MVWTTRLQQIIQRNQHINRQAHHQRETRNFSSSPPNHEKKSRGKPHPRNAFTGVYDMDRLTAAYPSLAPYVIRTRSGEECRPTVNYANPKAVRALNTALLVADYNVHPSYSKNLPPNALLPPVPGRADYIHHVADILQMSSPNNTRPTGTRVVGLDIGTGASAIYPTIATSAYGWKMIASEINLSSIESARKIVECNRQLDLIDLRHQDSNEAIFDGVLQPSENIDFVLCNPPFYSSLEAFLKENSRKVKGLEKGGLNKIYPYKSSKKNYMIQGSKGSNNFGGSCAELWCKGGEVSFIKQMISESKRFADRCLWFTSLVSRKKHLKILEASLFNMGSRGKGRHVQAVQKIQIGAGHKSSTILCWTYFDEKRRFDWARMRDWG